MLYIKANTIMLTRGDTAYIDVVIDREGEPYTLASGDKLTLSVKKYVTDEAPAFSKTTTSGNTIHIEPQDTAGLGFGTYKYDVQLNTASGDVFTVVDVGNFEVMPEVTV
jgi:hypothetical protein